MMFIPENLQYIPIVWVNLFSLMVVISKGCTINNKGRAIVVKKNSLKLKSNKEITMKNGFVCGIRLAVKLAEECLLATVAKADHCRQIDIYIYCTKNSDMCSKLSCEKWPNFMVGHSKLV